MRDTFDPESVHWVFDDEAYGQMIDQMWRSEEVVIDLENTGLDEYATRDSGTNGGVPARIVLASLTLPEQHHDESNPPPTYVIPLSHPDSPWLGQWQAKITDICQKIRQTGKPVTNQNLKYDLRWLYAHTGVDLTHLFNWDTQLSSHLLDENSSTKLKERAPATFDVPPWDDFDLSTPGAAEKVALFDLGMYGARDTYWTWRLAREHREQMGVTNTVGQEPELPEEVENYRLGRLSRWCVMPTGATLTAIEQRGMHLDTEWVHKELESMRNVVDEKFQLLTGLYELETDREPSFHSTSLWFQEWTKKAVEAKDLRIISYTDSGNPQWDRAVLIRLARVQRDRGAEINVPEELLAYRQASKRIEYLESWLEVVTPSGKVHTTYHAGRVITGRLSSSGPNLQQVTKPLKPAFIPSPGHYLAELDYCLEGSMRVLTSDLRWVPADQLTVGEKIIGFPEKVGKGAGRGHNYEESEVTSLRTLRRPSVVLVMEDGRQLRCSAEHRWLTFGQGKGTPRHWEEAQNLRPGDIIPTLTDPWEEPDPVDAAYLRGFLDGEGWVSQTTTGWGQLPGPVRDEVLRTSDRLGISWRQSNHLNNGVEQHIVTTMNESLRILGMVRPHRLLPKARQVWEGRQTYGKYSTGSRVVQVIPAGDQNVVAVGTSTKTMIVEGLLSHNSQIELRAAAHVAQCTSMIKAFNEGQDLHRLLAARITGKDPADVTPEERQSGKSANFGLLYMMSPEGFRVYAEVVYGVSFTVDEAVRVHRVFFEQWPEMSAWHARVQRRAWNEGQVFSPLGRIRRVPDIWTGNRGRSERQAINSPVQSFASDMMQMAAASIEGNLPGWDPIEGARLVGTVHDSIIVEVPKDDWETKTKECMDRMTGLDRALSALGCQLTVPLAVEATCGTRWGLGDIGKLEG